MAATGWEFRNRLLAILSAANYAGQPYVDIDCSKVHGDLGADLDPKPMSGYRDIMTKLMRPGDSILEDKMDGERAILMVRYLLKPKHN
jgi:hypothetical protein